MNTTSNAMSLENVEPNTLRNYLPFDNYDTITKSEFLILFKKLMSVDWVVGEKTINLTQKGWVIGWNNRKTALGVCIGRSKRIEISKFLLEHNLNKPNVWEDTIRHEIAHALEVEIRGKSDHGRIWKFMCRITGASPSRVCENPLSNGDTHKFELVCPNCNKSYKYYRKPKLGRACGKCCDKLNFGRFSEDFLFEIKRVA